MGIREEFAEYTDSDGLVQPWKDRSSGNGALYSSEFFIILVKLGLARMHDLQRFIDMVSSCSVDPIDHPGLLKRSPTHPDQQAHDDYIGVTTASRYLGTDHAEKILAYGEAHDFVFNNVEPGKFGLSAWLGRNPSFVAHLYFAAKRKPGFFLRIMWAASVAWSSFRPKKEQDSWILSWLLIQVYKASGQSCALCEAAIETFKTRLYRNWQDGMRGVVRDYFGYEHPLSAYWVTDL